MPKLEGSIYPAFQIVMLLLLTAAPAFIHFPMTELRKVDLEQKHAAIIIALAAGIIVGILAPENTSVYGIGGIRDAVLPKNINYCCGFSAILMTALVMNLILRCSYQEHPYFNPGILRDSRSHIQTDCGTHWECIWQALDVFSSVDARFVS